MFTCYQIERSHTDHAGTDVTDNVVDTVTLDETDRHRRRLMLSSDSGIEFLLELESATLLKHDDVLRLNDGRGIRVQARLESLYEVHGKDGRHLLTLAWHLGNRHLASEIRHDHVRIRCDPVIQTMLEQLGATVVQIQDSFNPEGGAYGDTRSAHSHPAHSHD